MLKKISASSYRSVNYPSNAVDGKLNTIWSSQSADSQWVQIELDSLYTIGKIVLYWGSYYSRRYVVQCSQDSVTWTSISVIEGGDGRKDELSFNSLKAKYLKLLLYQPSNNSGFGIQEIEIYRPSTVTGIEEEKILPSEFHLYQNYPNPFNSVTKIKFTIGSNAYTTLRVFDILGNEITTLINEETPSGIYEVEFNGSGLSSGVYFYTLSAGEFTKTNKFVLLK